VKGLSNAVSHRLRDTFAVELLLAGVPIERVSILLGHQSVSVTEKHYNPWVRSYVRDKSSCRNLARQ
jgi:integrase/recombinase XerD